MVVLTSLCPRSFLHRPNDVAGGRETVRSRLALTSYSGPYTVSGWRLSIALLSSSASTKQRRSGMRKAMPTMTESAAELQQRMQHEPDTKKRQRLPALSLAASGQARHRKDIATLLGVHRRRVAACFEAYAEGGLAQALPFRSGWTVSPPRFRIPLICSCWIRAPFTKPKPCAGLRTWRRSSCRPPARHAILLNAWGASSKTSWPTSGERRLMHDQMPCAPVSKPIRPRCCNH
jgi:hypothetical protein